MILADVLLWVSIPFTIATLTAAFYKGENNYYESDLYDGDGTAHKVLK